MLHTSLLAESQMTVWGWIFMISSMSVVISLAAFCYIKVIFRPSATDHMHAPLDLDIDTGDRDT